MYLLVLVALLSACNSTPKQEIAAKPDRLEEIPLAKKIYFLQHKILPEWTFTSDGEFYADLLQGDLTRIKAAASEVVSPSYALAIKSEVIAGNPAVLITFEQPKTPANCFYVIVQKSQDGFNFYTYEKTMNFDTGNAVVGVVGAWSADGSHSNFGGRTYTQASDFIADALNKNG
ncbi:MAG: hypothetical protein ACSHW0_18900 [Thalassotalea sp.]